MLYLLSSKVNSLFKDITCSVAAQHCGSASLCVAYAICSAAKKLLPFKLPAKQAALNKCFIQLTTIV